MSTRRHLPVLQAAPKPAPEEPPEAPPWHWIPLGSVISVLALIPLAPVMLAAMSAALQLVYAPDATPAERSALRRAAPLRVIGAELLASAMPVLAVLLCVALGGYVLGRRGERTNHRHGVLSGACTALLCGALSQRVVVTLVLVPLAMLVGGVSARWGVRRREKSAQHEP